MKVIEMCLRLVKKVKNLKFRFAPLKTQILTHFHTIERAGCKGVVVYQFTLNYGIIRPSQVIGLDVAEISWLSYVTGSVTSARELGGSTGRKSPALAEILIVNYFVQFGQIFHFRKLSKN